MTGTRATRTWR